MFNDIAKTNIEVIEIKNKTKAIQIIPYCYLIAAIELLLSNRFFIKFIVFYIFRDIIKYPDDSYNITIFCTYICNYVINKNDYGYIKNLYDQMNKEINKSLDIKEENVSEDINVVFLYFQKNKYYCTYFADFTYVYKENVTVSSKFLSIYSIILSPDLIKLKLTVEKTISKLDDNKYIYGLVFLATGHYEVYENYNGVYINKNTNYLYNTMWTTCIVLCCTRYPESEKYIIGDIYKNLLN